MTTSTTLPTLTYDQWKEAERRAMKAGFGNAGITAAFGPCPVLPFTRLTSGKSLLTLKNFGGDAYLLSIQTEEGHLVGDTKVSLADLHALGATIDAVKRGQA